MADLDALGLKQCNGANRVDVMVAGSTCAGHHCFCIQNSSMMRKGSATRWHGYNCYANKLQAAAATSNTHVHNHPTHKAPTGTKFNSGLNIESLI